MGIIKDMCEMRRTLAGVEEHAAWLRRAILESGGRPADIYAGIGEHLADVTAHEAQIAARVGAALGEHENSADAHAEMFGGLRGDIATFSAGYAKALSDQAAVVERSVKAHTREILKGGLTLHVRPDGSDSNDGSANTPEKALLTVGGALKKLVHPVNAYLAS